MNGLLLAWLVIDCIATFGVWFFLRSLVPLAPAATSPRAAVLVAIKGIDDHTAEFLDRLCAQGYPHYRVIVAMESRTDPLLALLEAKRRAVADRIDLEFVFAGYAEHRSQKVHNLLAALDALRDGDRIVVFTDADTLLPPDWLANLVRPVAIGEVGASTGYRWPLPQDRCLPTLIGAAADLSVTTSARSRHWNMCWGGSTAVAREALDSADIRAAWSRAASDDVTLTRALRARHVTINSPLRTLVPSPVGHTWAGLFGFARRQHLMLRTYAPRHWLLGGAVLCIPVIGAVSSLLLLQQSWLAAAALCASVAMLQLRLLARARIAARILPREAQAGARAVLLFSAWAWPLVHVVHCMAFLTSCLGRRFSWAGIKYRLDGQTVQVEAHSRNESKKYAS